MAIRRPLGPLLDVLDLGKLARAGLTVAQLGAVRELVSQANELTRRSLESQTGANTSKGDVSQLRFDAQQDALHAQLLLQQVELIYRTTTTAR